MIYVEHPCDNCKYQRENIDGWKCACDAFPEGLPRGFLFEGDIMKECNNGIRYEPKE